MIEYRKIKVLPNLFVNLMGMRIRRTLQVKLVLVIATLLSMMYVKVQAASFDCKKATTYTEKTICQNPILSTLDEEMVSVFNQVILNKQDAKSIEKQQLQWLQNTRNVCQTHECLEKVYRERIKELYDTPSKPVNLDNSELCGKGNVTTELRNIKEWEKCINKVSKKVDIVQVGNFGVEAAIKYQCGDRPVEESASMVSGIGVSPYDLVRSKTWKNRFISITKDKYDDFINRLEMSSGNTISKDGWIFGEGGKPHFFGSDTAAFAINISSGEVFAAILEDGDKITGFGFDSSWGNAPESLQTWKKNHVKIENQGSENLVQTPITIVIDENDKSILESIIVIGIIFLLLIIVILIVRSWQGDPYKFRLIGEIMKNRIFNETFISLFSLPFLVSRDILNFWSYDFWSYDDILNFWSYPDIYDVWSFFNQTSMYCKDNYVLLYSLFFWIFLISFSLRINKFIKSKMTKDWLHWIYACILSLLVVLLSLDTSGDFYPIQKICCIWFTALLIFLIKENVKKTSKNES